MKNITLHGAKQSECVSPFSLVSHLTSHYRHNRSSLEILLAHNEMRPLWMGPEKLADTQNEEKLLSYSRYCNCE